MKYDLVIVGAGPGGCMAARTAARAGLKVLLVEKNKKILARRLCSRLLRLGSGGFGTDKVPTDIESRGVTVSIEIDKSHSIIRPKTLPADAEIEYRGTWGPAFNETWLSPSGYRLSRDPDDFHISGFVVDKDMLLQGLADEAVDAGCKLRIGTKCVAIEDGPNGVSAKLKSGKAVETVHADRAIVADGSFSPLIEQLGFNEGRPKSRIRLKFLSLILDGLKAHVLDRHRLKFCIPSMHSSYITLGQWPPGKFQFGASTTAGSSIHLPDILNTLMTDSPFADWFVGAKVVTRLGCNMDLRPPVREPARGNVICVGDNAAFAEVAIKGAIGFGYMAANATKTALEGGDGNDAYNDYWLHAVNYFSPDYRRNTKRIKKLPVVLSDSESDSLFKWVQDNNIYGVPDDCLSAKREQLEAELPDIANKIFFESRDISPADTVVEW